MTRQRSRLLADGIATPQLAISAVIYLGTSCQIGPGRLFFSYSAQRSSPPSTPSLSVARPLRRPAARDQTVPACRLFVDVAMSLSQITAYGGPSAGGTVLFVEYFNVDY
ncbi:hypothetical protein GWI33_023163 [Rhynchophorus ferrugineus]|uniref:Uncharacterized protein n=1 Tax=Rhynchophorus ferrugineus TaxID=354439 RepID=A0A834HRF9_RHYFE|nr:hypothetical protein GWI33_023164 [Rhynchophorus ferrugineus]KAF7264471.1 hypothetical protein GWI33_023163 [Rhynchophorus ferrugineus]